MFQIATVNFLSMFVFAGLIAYVLAKDYKTGLNRSAAALFFSMFIWTSARVLFYFYGVETPEATILIGRYIAVSWTTMPALALLFSSYFRGIRMWEHKKINVIIIFFIIPLFFLVLGVSGVLLERPILTKYGWHNNIAVNIWSILYGVYASIYAVFVLRNYYLKGKEADEIRVKKQAFTLFWGTMILFIGVVSSEYIADIFLAVNNYKGLGEIFFLVWAGMATYAIYKNKLFFNDVDKLFRHVIERLNDIVIITDSSGYILDINKSGFFTIGKSASELRGKSIDEVLNMTEKHIDQISESEVDALKNGYCIDINGEKIPVCYTINEINTSEKDVLMFILKDTSKTVHMQEEHHRSQFMIDSAEEMLTLVGPDYRYITANESFCRAHGRTKEDIIGKRMDAVWDEKIFVDQIKEHIDKAFKGEKVHFRKKFRFPELKESIYDVTFYPYITGEGDISYVSVFTKDVNVEEKIKKDLRASQKKYKTIFENANSYLVYMSENGKIIDVNKKLLELAGKKKGDVVGKNFKDLTLIPEENYVDIIDGIKDIINGNKIYKEQLIKDKDGNSAILELYGVAVKKEDGSNNIIIVGRDITERKKEEAEKEEILVALNEAEKYSDIGKIAGGMAHEINNPLTGILTAGELLKEECPNENADCAENIDIIIENSKRIANTIKNLKSFVEEDNYEFKEVNIDNLIEASCNIVKANFKDIKFIKENSSDVQKVNASPEHLKLAFINVLLNAAESMSGSGKIYIKLYKEKEYFVISIKDSGPGIPEKKLKHIFEASYSSNTKRGIGLGLPKVKQIIDHHAGKTEVHSEVSGTGTEFKIYLPID